MFCFVLDFAVNADRFSVYCFFMALVQYTSGRVERVGLSGEFCFRAAHNNQSDFSGFILQRPVLQVNLKV